MSEMYKLLISWKGSVQEPVCTSKITIKRVFGLNASTMEFECVKDDELNYGEGAGVVLLKDGKRIFSGYIFKKSRDKKQIIKNLCYDQLRYMKNKDTFLFEDLSYSDILRKICNHQGLMTGDIEDTGYIIPGRVERNKEYFSMLKSAYDITLAHTGVIFTLFDDAGKICLKKPQSMLVNDAITFDNACNFSYTTSIENSYNRVKLSHIDDKSKEVKSYVKEDVNHIKEWGLLQYFDESSDVDKLEGQASGLFELLNKKERTLEIKNAIGNWDIRGGSLVPVIFNAIGDIVVNSVMFVAEVIHNIEGDHHFMDLKVYNKDILPRGGK